MHGDVLCCGAAFLLLGCKPDALWFPGREGAIGAEIAAEQSNLCHPDCSTEALQVSPQMSFTIGYGAGEGFPVGPVGPGVYQAPAPDGGIGVLEWSVGGVCDQVPPFPKAVVSGTVTLTHVPADPSERLEGSYKIDPSGGPYGFTEGTFSAHTCQ
jgi:hypothetical protein